MPKIRTLFKVLKNNGLKGVVVLFKNKFNPFQAKPIKKFELYKSYFKNKKGIEIGGPSKIFSLDIPIYPVIESLDGCNFSNQTIWEGNISKGNNYNYFNNKKGVQYICEASDLNEISSEKYDFLIASHCLEHCANTLKTVEEWVRVVKKGGVLLLVLPNRKYTFDHNRHITKFEHLVDDFMNIDERDLTHLEEILEKYDLNKDKADGSKEQFEKRSFDNYKNRCLHDHIFDFNLLKKIFFTQKIKVINTSSARPYHQIILGIKK